MLTTYGTMRVDDAALADVGVGPRRRRRGPARQEPAGVHGARAAHHPEPRRGWRSTGTPVENNLTELWAILDWATPGPARQPQRVPQGLGGADRVGPRADQGPQFADLIGPFLLRRRKSDPGIAPELPAKTETDHPLGLTREQVVLYEAFVRDTMERIERADEEARRGLVLALLTGLKQICNHPAQFLKQSGAVRLTGRSEKLDLLDELLGTVLRRGRRRARLHPVRRHGPAPREPPDRDRACRTSSSTAARPVREREAMVADSRPDRTPVGCRSSCCR